MNPTLELPNVALSGIAPELALVVAAVVVLIVDAFVAGWLRGWYLPILSSLGLVAAGYLALVALGTDRLQLGQMIAVDDFAVFAKVTLAVFALLTIWLARDYLVRERLEEAEFYALVLLATAGMMLMASAADLIVMFLALETFSISIYVLVGFRRRSLASPESALKYFLLGSFSSAFFLLGIAFVYGAIGSTHLYGSEVGRPGVVQALGATPATDLGLLVIASGLLVIGLAFKVAAVPFHMWTPDAYQGAPSPVTAFMAAATKLAAFAAVLRLFDAVLWPLRWDWRPLVIVIAAVTMLAGSIFAVVQEDLKRLLAYSSIAHAGFVLTAVIAANDRSVSSALFYLATYGLSVLGAFATVALVADRDERRVRLVDHRGLFYERPLLAGALTLFLLSLAGVPLTSGFVAKLVVFSAAIEAGYAWLVVVGVIASVIAAFFYLRVMVVMYMQEREGPAAPRPARPLASAVIGATAVATVVFGLFWGPLIEAAERATLVTGR